MEATNKKQTFKIVSNSGHVLGEVKAHTTTDAMDIWVRRTHGDSCGWAYMDRTGKSNPGFYVA